jgi:transcriptional regulator with XRE-family HTH domain
MAIKTPRDPFIREVRAGLARKGATQSDLATALEISRGQVGRRLSGEVPFGHQEVIRIAHFLDMSVEELYARPDGFVAGSALSEVAS